MTIGTQRSLAQTLQRAGVSVRTVGIALCTLIALGLLYRAVKGILRFFFRHVVGVKL